MARLPLPRAVARGDRPPLAEVAYTDSRRDSENTWFLCACTSIAKQIVLESYVIADAIIASSEYRTLSLLLVAGGPGALGRRE